MQLKSEKTATLCIQKGVKVRFSCFDFNKMPSGCLDGSEGHSEGVHDTTKHARDDLHPLHYHGLC
jgi:hypothetical protein